MFNLRKFYSVCKLGQRTIVATSNLKCELLQRRKVILFTSIASIHSSHKEFYAYLKQVHSALLQDHNSGPSKWPPFLQELLGQNPSSVMTNLEVLVSSIDDLNQKIDDLEGLDSLISDSNLDTVSDETEELKTIALEEKSELLKEIEDNDKAIISTLTMLAQKNEDISSVIMEVTPGVGGQEAMLFASDLFDMYESFSCNMGHGFEVLGVDRSESGGIQMASATIQFADNAFYGLIRHESGIHRVQRVPVTDRTGRIHTSTASVVLLPVYESHSVKIEEKDVEIKPLKKSNSGGGQHANKTESAVRVRHIPSGLVVECNASRSQYANRETALDLLQKKLSSAKAESQESELSRLRRQQVRHRERSDKIRTYNFSQGRVTDHRIGFSIQDIDGVMSGQTPLFNIMKKLEDKYRSEELETVMSALLSEGNKYFENPKQDFEVHKIT